MYWIVVASLIIGGLLLLDLIVRLFFARVILKEFEKKLATTRSSKVESDENAEPIQFATSDGLTLRGSLHGDRFGRPRGLVIFCPEVNGDHRSAAEYCRGLLEAGFLVLAFDFRNHGESDAQPDYEPLHWVTNYELRDVRAALDFARSRDDLRDLPIGLMGVSRGGGVALAAAAADPSIKAVAVEGAFTTSAMQLHYTIRNSTMYVPAWFLKLVPDWHLLSTLKLCRWISERRRNCRYTNLERLLPKLSDRPVLMIVGGHDSHVPLSVPNHIRSLIAGEECDLWTVGKAKHNRARKVDENAYDTRIREFFTSNLDVMNADAFEGSEADARQPSKVRLDREPAHQTTAG